MVGWSLLPSRVTPKITNRFPCVAVNVNVVPDFRTLANVITLQQFDEEASPLNVKGELFEIPLSDDHIIVLDWLLFESSVYVTVKTTFSPFQPAA